MRVETHPDVAAGLADADAMRTSIAEALGRGIAATSGSAGSRASSGAAVDRAAFAYAMGEVSACEPIEEEFVVTMQALWGARETEVDVGVEAYLRIIREQADSKRAGGENAKQFLRRQLQRFDLDELKGLSFDEFRKAGECIGLPLSLGEAQRLFDAMPKLGDGEGDGGDAGAAFDAVERAGIDEAVMFVFGTDPQPVRG